MKTKITLYIILGTIIAISFYLFLNKENYKQADNFIPPPAFSVLNELPTMISSTSSTSNKKTIYINETLGLSIEFPTELSLKNEITQLQKYELGSGEDKLGQEYKYYEINFSDNNNTELSTSIIIKVKETPYSSIDQWLKKDITRGGYFPEETVKFEPRNMFGESVLFGFDDWYNINSLPATENDNSEYVYVIKNSLLYRIEINNLSKKERDDIWNSIKFSNI